MNIHKLNAMYKVMESNLKEEDKPCVGIFWYSIARKECFGVIKAKEGDANYSSSGYGMFTCKELHKYIWEKEYNYRKYHPTEGINLFRGDYKDTPRGRVFYDLESNHYYIMVGSWIKDCPEAEKCILDTFKLNGHGYSFEVDIRWEIGMGYGD